MVPGMLARLLRLVLGTVPIGCFTPPLCDDEDASNDVPEDYTGSLAGTTWKTPGGGDDYIAVALSDLGGAWGDICYGSSLDELPEVIRGAFEWSGHTQEAGGQIGGQPTTLRGSVVSDEMMVEWGEEGLALCRTPAAAVAECD